MCIKYLAGNNPTPEARNNIIITRGNGHFGTNVLAIIIIKLGSRYLKYLYAFSIKFNGPEKYNPVIKQPDIINKIPAKHNSFSFTRV